ncbi:MAG: NADH-dependent [FeFe] hydrogenase, group A6 [Halanaerobium sp.]|nr:NADH-dependent [FeFe] hydrogenase, group A6 [Halanaerobium sp.]
MSASLQINGRKIEIDGEENLLQLIRKAGIQLPTFCYHSELSVYGACRMCVVEEEEQGILAACSTKPREGMRIWTHTERVQHIRKMALELLLANHDRECTICEKNGQCKLQDLSEQFGIREVRFGERDQMVPVDDNNPSIVRNPNKCILCGDCVRMCKEVQGVGAIDFANRGSGVTVTPAFNKELHEVECVYCGQCVAVCPTGALTIKSDVRSLWYPLNAPEKTVVAQIAPAVRVAIGEGFGYQPGEINLGQLVAALKRVGFDRVFDTSFAADLTVLEETDEFLARLQEGVNLPQFTSCCPGWVKFAEQYYPEYVDNLSSCRSPQQMFGSVAKKYYTRELGIRPEELVVVSIMPCTAKKFEAERPEFRDGGTRDVDIVITTQEAASLIKEAGICFAELEVESLDLPFGFATGAGVIFGVTGGVSEAVLRAAHERATGQSLDDVNFQQVRGMTGSKEAAVEVAGQEVRIAVVNGLQNSKELLERIKNGEAHYHLVEVMACPGGCVGGGGQPLPNDTKAREQRGEGLYRADKILPMHKSQQNPVLNSFYEKWFAAGDRELVHKALHTHYHNRRRISGERIPLAAEGLEQVEVAVCVGTCCYMEGSYPLLQSLMKRVKELGQEEQVNIHATFCFENCQDAPNVKVGDKLLSGDEARDIDRIIAEIQARL